MAWSPLESCPHTYRRDGTIRYSSRHITRAPRLRQILACRILTGAGSLLRGLSPVSAERRGRGSSPGGLLQRAPCLRLQTQSRYPWVLGFLGIESALGTHLRPG